MQRCQYCRAELPNHARFCGVCGRVMNASRDLPTDPSGASITDLGSINIPTGLNSQTYLASMKAEQEQQGLDLAARRVEPEDGTTVRSPLSEYRESDDREAIWPDLLLPGLADRQTPPVNIPNVQGTPQPGGVPTVQGTPVTPNTPPAGQAAMQHAAPPSAAPPHAASWAPHILPRRHQPTHHHHHLHSGRLHRPHLRNTAAHLMANTTSKVILLVVTAIVVLAGSGIGLILAHQPGSPVLSLSGGSNVTPGSVMHLHGRGFSAGGGVVLSLDHNLSFAFSGSSATKTTSNTGGAESAASLLMMGAEKSNQSSALNNTIKVSNTGIFDVPIVVLASWPPGPHTIQATDGSQSAKLQFNVLPMPARLIGSPFSLDFGKLEKGRKAVISVAVTNAGAQRLIWTADARGTPWLSLQSKAGAIELNGSQEFIYVTADTTNLQLGAYSATLQIHSNGGDKLVGIKLQVVPPPVPVLAKLNVNPTSLHFGQLQAGQQSTLNVALGNIGTQTLSWKADTGNASWLMLNQTTGIVKPGDLPQTLQVTADATHLMPGNYTAMLQISSNGGNASIQVTLVVTHSQPGPPAPPPPVLTASPYSFNTPGDPGCSYSANSGWICTASLSSDSRAHGNLNWSASSSGVSGVTFTPSHGVLSPGRTTKVTIIIPNMICPAQATFMFKGPRNTLDILWNCATSAWSFSPNNFKAETDCRYAANSGWTCTGKLALASGSEGNLKWSASAIGLSGIQFTPSSGILSPNQPVQVTVAVPNTKCPTNALLNFSASGEIPIAVPWTCGKPPILVVNPTSLSAKTDCDRRASGWTCAVTLEPASGSQGNLSWFADSGLPGVVFNPSSGTLSPGGRATVTISVPNDDCSADNSFFTFTGPGNYVNVKWNCIKQPPILLVDQKSFTAYDSNCPYDDYSNGWICTATLREAPGSQFNLDWFTDTSLDGVYFTPPNGTLTPNQSMSVSIFVPGSACKGGSFTFSGPENVVRRDWSCTPRQKLEADPYSLSAGDANCPPIAGGWKCKVTLDETSNSQGSLTWFADTNLPGVTFDQRSGTLSPGNSTVEGIFVSQKTCHSFDTFTFKGPANIVNVQWNCSVPPLLRVSPSKFNVNKDCDGSEIEFWTCTVMLSSDQNAQSNLVWSASSSSQIYSDPTNGTLTPSQSVPVTIYVPSAACTNGSGGSLTFSGPANSADVTLSCSPPPILTISRDTFTADRNCPSGEGGWTCNTVLSSKTGSQVDLNWTASSGFSGVTFTPASGKIPPGQRMPVSIFISSSACQDGSFSFSGPANTVSANWHCTSKPTFTASLDSCPYSTGRGWSCVATLISNSKNLSNLNWSATSSGMSGITLSSQSGTLSPGQTAKVNISILDTNCPANATFTFTGPANTVPLMWSCSAPVLTADTGSNSNCPSVGKGNYTCTATLALAQGSQGYLNWSASSSLAGVKFNPSGGTLHPNQSRPVTITIPSSDCPSVSVSFSGTGSNTVSKTLQCNTSTPTPTPSPSPTPTPTPTLTPTPTPSPTPTPTPMPTPTPSPTPTPTPTPAPKPTPSPTPTPTPSPTPTPPPPTPTPTPTPPPPTPTPTPPPPTPTPPPPTPTPTPPPPTPTPTPPPPTPTPTPPPPTPTPTPPPPTPTPTPPPQSQQSPKLDFALSSQSQDWLNPSSRRPSNQSIRRW